MLFFVLEFVGLLYVGEFVEVRVSTSLFKVVFLAGSFMVVYIVYILMCMGSSRWSILFCRMRHFDWYHVGCDGGDLLGMDVM